MSVLVTNDVPGAVVETLFLQVSVGAAQSIKLVGRYELRYEDNDEELELRPISILRHSTVCVW